MDFRTQHTFFSRKGCVRWDGCLSDAFLNLERGRADVQANSDVALYACIQAVTDAPDTTIVCLSGTADYSDVQADNFGYKLTRLVFEHVNVSSALHPGNTLLLQGKHRMQTPFLSLLAWYISAGD